MKWAGAELGKDQRDLLNLCDRRWGEASTAGSDTLADSWDVDFFATKVCDAYCC